MRILILCLAMLAGCSSAPTGDMSADARFQEHVALALDEMWQEFPELAVRNGNYKYADQLTVPDQARRQRGVAFYDRQLAALVKFDPAALSASNGVDLELMKNRFERNRWYIVTVKSWQWQPSTYNVGPDLDLVLDTEYAPLDVRLRQTLARLDKVPAYYAAAKSSIADPTAEHIDLALRQSKGTLALFGADLAKKVDASGLTPQEKSLFGLRADAAKAAIADYVAYLGTLKGTRNFRIGPELYQQKFAYEIQSGFTADELYRRALPEKTAPHDAMDKRARELRPQYMGNAPVPAHRPGLVPSLPDVPPN